MILMPTLIATGGSTFIFCKTVRECIKHYPTNRTHRLYICSSWDLIKPPIHSSPQKNARACGRLGQKLRRLWFDSYPVYSHSAVSRLPGLRCAIRLTDKSAPSYGPEEVAGEAIHLICYPSVLHRHCRQLSLICGSGQDSNLHDLRVRAYHGTLLLRVSAVATPQHYFHLCYHSHNCSKKEPSLSGETDRKAL